MNLQSVFDSLASDASHTIHLSPGIYRQKLVLRASNIKLIGKNAQTTRIVYNDYSYKLHQDGLLYNTFRTSTFCVTGNHNTFEQITFENDAGSGLHIGQAIALSLYGNHNHFKGCIIKGNQDTLFIGPLPFDLTQRYAHVFDQSMLQNEVTNQYFESCAITGNVDFIFGSGNAFFKSCNLILNKDGYLAAPSTIPGGIGLVFNECVIAKENPNHQLRLARPWRANGKTYFIHCQFDGVSDERYDAWQQSLFDFAEYPYVESPLSRPLNHEEYQLFVSYFKF